MIRYINDDLEVCSDDSDEEWLYFNKRVRKKKNKQKPGAVIYFTLCKYLSYMYKTFNKILRLFSLFIFDFKFSAFCSSVSTQIYILSSTFIQVLDKPFIYFLSHPVIFSVYHHAAWKNWILLMLINA